MTDESVKLIEDALWEDIAMEVVNTLDYDFQKMFRRNKGELEKLGRYIIRDRKRKYQEGVADAPFLKMKDKG